MNFLTGIFHSISLVPHDARAGLNRIRSELSAQQIHGAGQGFGDKTKAFVLKQNFALKIVLLVIIMFSFFSCT